MSRGYVFGPVLNHSTEQPSVPDHWPGSWFAIGPNGNTDVAIGSVDTWDAVVARLPVDWHPEFLALNLPNGSVPLGVWQAPVPIVGLVHDWRTDWHLLRRQLRRCDLILTDAVGADVIARQGDAPVKPAFLGCATASDSTGAQAVSAGDIDILVLGDLHPAVQREQLPWVDRLAQLGDQWRVVVRATGAGADYRSLLKRTQVAFLLGCGVETSRLAVEVAAAGVPLFLPAGSGELSDFLTDRRECVYCTPERLRARLEHYLENDEERRALAAAAQAKAASVLFLGLGDANAALVERAWPEIVERFRQRMPCDEGDILLDRTWQILTAGAGRDPALVDDLGKAVARQPSSAALENALGLALLAQPQPTKAALEAGRDCFASAWRKTPRYIMAGLNLAEVLLRLGERSLAVNQAWQTLAALERDDKLDPSGWDAGHFPIGINSFRVEWERAAWLHAGSPADEIQAKKELLRWRLHSLLAHLTGDLVHYYEAAFAQPELPPARAALGCALARRKRFREAVGHLNQAVALDPLDRDAARSLFQALGEVGDALGQQELVRRRRLLACAAPELVPPEKWFAGDLPANGASDPQTAEVAPQADGSAFAPGREPLPEIPACALRTGVRPRVSLSMIVRNEEANLPGCLESAADLVDEVIVVDTGSTDRTKEVAARFGAKVFDFPWVDSFAAARNESLRHATGEWVFWLDADDRLDATNRERLRRLFGSLGDGRAAYSMTCLCLPDPHAPTATEVIHVRLFPNRPAIRWRYRVHEQILPALRGAGGTVIATDVVIQHTGYQDVSLRRRKHERDFRLLPLDHADNPEDPFILFNLGWLYTENGHPTRALPFLRGSLERSHPHDSIVRKLYALIVQCHCQTGQPTEALEACRAGRQQYPDDLELIFQEGRIRRTLGDDAGAEACFRRALGPREKAHFASVDTGLSGYKARHNLAVIYREKGRLAEAEEQWRAAVSEAPSYLPAWLGLGDLYISQARWANLDNVLLRLDARSEEAVGLRARGLMGRKEYRAARELLEEAIARFPDRVYLRTLLSHALLQEGRDWEAAEKAVRAVLALDSDNAGAKANLAALLKQNGGFTEVQPSKPSLPCPIGSLESGSKSQIVHENERLARHMRHSAPAQIYEGRYSLRTPKGSVEIPFSVRGLEDLAIIHEVWVDDAYRVRGLAHPPHTVIDIGAHIGAFSLLATLRSHRSITSNFPATPSGVASWGGS